MIWIVAADGVIRERLPDETLLVFLSDTHTSDRAIAMVCGALALVALLAGYVLGAGIRGFPSATALMVFWGLAAVLVGPPLGLSAHWVRAGRPALAALGAGVPAGVLIGEGVYGLRVISGTTFPPFWWTEIALGVLLLCVVAAIRLRHPRPVILSVASAVVVGLAFVAVYSQDLISRV
jgi:hypothetical protein